MLCKLDSAKYALAFQQNPTLPLDHSTHTGKTRQCVKKKKLWSQKRHDLWRMHLSKWSNHVCTKSIDFQNKHIELPAKLLDYFFRSNKSNINQWRIPSILPFYPSNRLFQKPLAWFLIYQIPVLQWTQNWTHTETLQKLNCKNVSFISWVQIFLAHFFPWKQWFTRQNSSKWFLFSKNVRVRSMRIGFYVQRFLSGGKPLYIQRFTCSKNVQRFRRAALPFTPVETYSRDSRENLTHGDFNENLKTCKLQGLQWNLEKGGPQIFW